MNKLETLKLIEPHKDNLTTVKEWDVYAKEHELPSSFNLIYIFGSWNETKKAFNLKGQKASYTLEELKQIAIKHKEYLSSIESWDQYYKDKGLPSSSTFINAFGKWSKLKDFIGIKKGRSDSYSKEQIERVLKEHAANYQSREQWDIYAKEHKLPTYRTIKKHFTYDEILNIVGKNKTINFTKKDLIKIAAEHRDIFLTASMTSWDEYASDHKLPSSHTFFSGFGSWRNAKDDVWDAIKGNGNLEHKSINEAEITLDEVPEELQEEVKKHIEREHKVLAIMKFTYYSYKEQERESIRYKAYLLNGNLMILLTQYDFSPSVYQDSMIAGDILKMYKHLSNNG